MSIHIPVNGESKKVKSIFASVPHNEIDEFHLYGKATQDGTPTPDAPIDIDVAGSSGSVVVKSCGKNLFENIATTQTISGVTCTVNEDGSITLNGTKSAVGVSLVLNSRLDLVKGSSYIITDGNNATGLPCITSNVVKPDGTSITDGFTTYDNNRNIYTREEDGVYIKNVRLWLGTAEVTYNNLTLYPMIRRCDENGNPIGNATYEPYKETSATIQTNGLAGIKVSDGGNYTDSNGQQWICDEIVKYADGSGEYVKRVEKISNPQFIIASGYTLETSELFACSAPNGQQADDRISSCVLCNKLPFNRSVLNNDVSGMYQTYTKVFARIPGVTTAEEFNSLMADSEIYHILAEPITTPLTAEEIAEIENLKGFYPVTNITTDSECGIDATVNTYWETKRIKSILGNVDGEVKKLFGEVSGMQKRFVCVGNDGASYYSTDGENWVAMAGLESKVYKGVTYGNDRFVCVGMSGKSYYSIDGENWVAMSGHNIYYDYYSVTYGNDRFVCVGEDGITYYSLDGENWVAMSGLNTSHYYYSVTYGNDRFVCVGIKSIHYSLDGENWVAMSGYNIYYTYRGVTYGNDRFVCVGDDGITYYSLDGENWVAMSGLDTYYDYYSVTYGNDRFICVGTKGKSYYSIDGETWTAMTGLEKIMYKGVTYGNDRFVCVGEDGASYYSTDGENWVAMAGLESVDYNAVCYG